ncbi:signal peptidase II [Parapedobacter sp. 10938]|uniref:signal peptidase II n=1 Tax=Parapedobacter flavus TaxID=3110225 RepID=UPI002DBE23EE|nr:signal peptidase II [Parapedobacter sp. 10938]MEC3881779.1 signal peptidase II [Parapedobacter sp. 10938]
MKFKRWAGTLFGIILISVNISCDQLTKAIVRKQISPSEQITVISDYLTLTNIENSGAFLSMGQTWWQPLKSLLFIVLPTVMLLLGAYYMMRLGGKRPWLTLALGFAIGGGVGNMIDRWLYGSVTDFVHIRVGPLQTGIFNMADVSIMIGVGVMLLFTLRGKRKTLIS